MTIGWFICSKRERWPIAVPIGCHAAAGDRRSGLAASINSQMRLPPTVSSTRWIRFSLPSLRTSWVWKESNTQLSPGSMWTLSPPQCERDAGVGDDGDVNADMRPPVIMDVDMGRHDGAGAKPHQAAASPDAAQLLHEAGIM